MREPHQHQPVPGRAAMRALPLLLLFPAFLVAWPLFGAPLRDDPFPHLAGSAWVALASVPLALVLFRTTSRTKLHARGLGTLLALWVFVALRVFLRSGTDWFEAIRALTLVSTWPVLFLGGAQLDTHGRRALGRGLVWLSLLVTASALVRSRFTGDLSGVLGNTGPLSQLALPGAVIGAWYVATRRGRYFLIGALAVTSFLLHAGLAPVLAGGLVFTLVLVASSLLSPWAKGRAQVRRRLGMLAALSVFGFVVLQGPRSADSPEPAAESPVAALTRSGGNLGGVEVRLRIWRSIAPVLASRPLLGLGPGQFQARYPRYRDPREIEASRGGVCSTRNTEADHAHNDLLHGLAELGLVGGAIWLAFLLLSLRASLSALSQTDFPTIGLGAGALAILFASLFHSPLWFNPPASAVALVLFGSVLGRSRSATRAPMRPGIALTCLTVLLIGLFRGHLLIGHGRALAAYVESVRSAASGDPAADPATLAATSLTRYPASAPLRLIVARTRRDPASWESALELRPDCVEALTSLGLARIASGDPAGARTAWLHALTLSPTLPTLLRNLTRLEFTTGDPAQARTHLARLTSLGCPDPTWSTSLGADLILSGDIPNGSLLLYPPSGTLPSPELLAQRADSTTPLGRAHRVLSHLLWAREQAAAGDWATAVRSYRQALTPTKAKTPGGAPTIRVELAAALSHAGRPLEAEGEIQGLALTPEQQSSLPPWAADWLPER